LASQLQNHTTLLITAEQVGLLDEYFNCAVPSASHGRHEMWI